MLTLYFAPFACSLSPHIALREAGLPFALSRVDLRRGKTAEGEDFRALNPKGYVPALKLDGGDVLTEGAVIVQYIADLAPQAQLAPPPGSFARYRLQEWLVYVSTELHKQFAPLFSPTLPDAQRRRVSDKIRRRCALIEQQLESAPFLLGEQFSVADGYAFTVLRWARDVRLSLGDFPRLAEYMERIAQRPAVAGALAAERAARDAKT